MIKALGTLTNYCSTSYTFLREKAGQTCNAVNETINRIGLINIGLFGVCLTISLVQNNIIILSGILGGIFHNQVNDITNKIAELFNHYLWVVEPLGKVSKIGEWVVHTVALVVSVIAIIILAPVTALIVPPIFFGAILGARLVTDAKNSKEQRLTLST